MTKKLSTNTLKIVAIISMIIDHIGYYFSYMFDTSTYSILRIMGRIAMPIFLFLIVEGYFHTRDVKRYILRVSMLAIVTQILLKIMQFINVRYYPLYVNPIAEISNILFGFAILLIVIYLFEKCIAILREYKILKISQVLKMLGAILAILTIVSIYGYLSIDYGYLILILGAIYYIRKKANKYIGTLNPGALNRFIVEIPFVINILLVSALQEELGKFLFLALPLILLYSEKMGKKSTFLKTFFYAFFPIHHIALYFIAMALYVE